MCIKAHFYVQLRRRVYIIYKIVRYVALTNNHQYYKSKNYPTDVVFLTDGHPWWIQKIAKDAYSEVLAIGRDQVTSRIIEKTTNDIWKKLNLIMKNGL